MRDCRLREHARGAEAGFARAAACRLAPRVAPPLARCAPRAPRRAAPPRQPGCAPLSLACAAVLTGELHSLVLGISNEGDRPVNLTVVQVRARRVPARRAAPRRRAAALSSHPARAAPPFRRLGLAPQAWLEHPQDPSQRLWNFSRQMVGEVLEAGRETAIEYRLPVPRMAEASQDVRLVAVVQYADTARAARWAVVTAYNSSLTFAANPLPFDVRAYSPYVLATLVLAGAAMLFRELLTSSGKKSKAAGAYDVADDEPTVAVVPGGRQRRKNDKA